MSDKPVWMENWHKDRDENIENEDGSTVLLLMKTPEHGRSQWPQVMAIAAAAPQLVRALLQCEWEGVDGRDADQACPVCGAWVCTGRNHGSTCVVDAALTAAGFPDQASRDEARKRMAGK